MGLSKKAAPFFFGMRPSRRKIMACFTIPLAEGIILSVAKKIAFKKDAESALKARLGHLENMLYGGSFLLAIEHIYHGEVVLYPPFLTAMRNPEDIPEIKAVKRRPKRYDMYTGEVISDSLKTRKKRRFDPATGEPVN